MKATSLALALVLAGGTAARADSKLELSVEGGSEVDTNPHRQTGERPSDGVLVTRLGARLEASGRPAPRKALGLRLIVAGKKFLGGEDVADEDVAVVTGEVRGEARAAEAPLVLGARFGYYDAIERDTVPSVLEHDFRTADGSLSLALLGEHDQRVTLVAGVRGFVYKPDSRYDFVGEHVDLGWRRRFLPAAPAPGNAGDDASWELAVHLGVARRVYDADVVVDACPLGRPTTTDCLDLSADGRTDLALAAGLAVTYTGTVLIDGRYDVTYDRSNSFGQSYVRHRLEVGVTSELPWNLVGTLRAVVQVSQSLDGLLFAPEVGVLTIEDENRNALSLQLVRELTPTLGLELRSTIYRNEFATREAGFARETVYLGLLARLW
jgi:hypothetical protein